MSLIRRTAGRRAPETLIIGPFDAPIPRYAWHRPAWSYAVSMLGLKAYQPKEKAGEGAAIRDEFRWPDGTDAVAKWGIIWLALEWPQDRSWEIYRRGGYRVDLRKLNPLSLRLSGGVQGHLWHLGDIPAEAVVVEPRGRRAFFRHTKRVHDKLVLHHGGSSAKPLGEVAHGLYLTLDADNALYYAGRAVERSGGKPVVHRFRLRDLRAAGGSFRLDDEELGFRQREGDAPEDVSDWEEALIWTGNVIYTGRLP